jgi:hypothetical protein
LAMVSELPLLLFVLPNLPRDLLRNESSERRCAAHCKLSIDLRFVACKAYAKTKIMKMKNEGNRMPSSAFRLHHAFFVGFSVFRVVKCVTIRLVGVICSFVRFLMIIPET